MVVTENGKRIYLLGDPHLGRAFVNGVPLHRRGERERLVWKDFLAALDGAADCDFHICLGDLFDKWAVPFDLILDTAAAYKRAAKANPNTWFFILKGNHDWTRDLERRSAFDVFAALVTDTPTIRIITNPSTVKEGGFILYPWHPLWDAKEKLAPLPGNILFGHFDTEFGEHNMVPTKLSFERIYTGHVHKADRFNRDGTEVVIVGSLQPYAHGEESTDDLYVTLRADQLVGAGDLTNKCVRILGPCDVEVDCLQLTFKQEKMNDDGQLDSVTLGDFDMDKLFAEAFAEAGVSSERTADVLGQYHSKRATAGV